MCRFLLRRSQDLSKSQGILSQFAQMCKESRSPEGDLQEDGWGVAWTGENSYWHSEKSLKPIWEDGERLAKIPPTTMLVVHARSAGFADQKGIVEYNQPYISGGVCFVFNGMIRGVSIKRQLEGKIGAQKIFSLLLAEGVQNDPLGALTRVQKIVGENSRAVEGMNIGVVTKDTMAAMCQFRRDPEYFSLQCYRSTDLTMVSSEKIGDFAWQTMRRGEIKKF